MKFIASVILVFLVGFTGTALAAEAVADPVASELFRQIFDAVMHGQWWAAAAAATIGVCAFTRWYMPESWKTGTKGDIIGVSLAFATAFAGAIATWFAAPGAVMSFAVVATATKVGAVAIGGFTIIHKVIGWLVAWGKLPAWATSMLGVIAMLIGSNAVKKAEAAGAAAVAADPAPGMAGDGTMKEIE